MAGPYSYLGDDELESEIADYRAALKGIALGGKLKVIAGEGRRKEFAQGDVSVIRGELRELLAEAASRNLDGFSSSGGSLLIDFGHGGPFDDGFGAPSYD